MVGKNLGAEGVLVEHNDHHSVEFRANLVSPVIGVGFSGNDKYAATSEWSDSDQASIVLVFPLSDLNRRSGCSFKNLFVDAIRVQNDGESFTVIGRTLAPRDYTSDDSDEPSSTSWEPSTRRRSRLVNSATCKALGRASFESLYREYDWTPDGTTIAYVPHGDPGVVHVQNLVSGIIAPVNVDGPTRALALSPDGEYLYTTITGDPTATVERNFVKMYSTHTRMLLACVRIRRRPFMMATSPNGEWLWLSSCSQNGINDVGCDVNVWNTGAWRHDWLPWNKTADSLLGKFFARQTGMERYTDRK